jgi:hypothetical protein
MRYYRLLSSFRSFYTREKYDPLLSEEIQFPSFRKNYNYFLLGKSKIIFFQTKVQFSCFRKKYSSLLSRESKVLFFMPETIWSVTDLIHQVS